MKSITRRSWAATAAMAAIALTALGSLASAPIAQAADAVPPADTITWAVRPSDGNGADGRTWMELALDAGQSTTEHLVVTNLSDVAGDFRLTAADGYFTSSGRFNMLPADQASTDAGTWISIGADHVSLAAGESTVVPFTVSVPDNATPGDHPAGVAASVLSVAQSEGGARMGVDSRVGFRVMTRVAGELAPGLALSDIHAAYQTNWNPFAPGSVDVIYQAENTGNTRLALDPVQVTAGPLHAEAAPPADPVELFPGDRRELTATVVDVWPLGFATVRVAAGGEILPEGSGVAPTAASEEVLIWAMPWSQLVVACGLGLIVFALLWGRRRQKAKVEKLIEEARTEGARDVLLHDADAGASR